MKKNYYFVGVSLPELSFSQKPEIEEEELFRLFKDNLTKGDLKKIEAIALYYDLLNLYAYWRGDELDPKGTMDLQEIEEALVTQNIFPVYVQEYIERYPQREDQIRNFSQLLEIFFQKASQNIPSEFLRDYFAFERQLRLVMLAFRAKKLGRDLTAELQFENPEEEFIAQLLAYKDSSEFIPPEKFARLADYFNEFYDKPLALQKAIDQYRFDTIEEMVDFADGTSIDRLLAYLLQFIIVTNWTSVDKSKGKQILDSIAEETR